MENGIAPESLWFRLHNFVASLRHLEQGLEVILGGEKNVETSGSQQLDGQLLASQQLAELIKRLHKRMRDVLKEESA